MSGFEPTGGHPFVQDVGTILSAVFRDASEDAIERFDLPLSFDFMLPDALDYGKERGAEMIGRKLVDGQLVPNPDASWVIDEHTRDRSNALLQQAIEEGWSPEHFADQLQKADLFGEGRAEMIARTEVAIAQGRAKAQTYKAAGLEQVVVLDGDFDEECAAANGQVWTVEEADENPIEHPNCERDFRPLTREEREADDEEED